MKKIKLKIKPNFSINIHSIREDSEKKINDKIKENNISDLIIFEKRIAILKEEKSTIYNSNKKNSFELKNIKEAISKNEYEQKFNIDVEEIRKEYEKKIKEKIENNKLSINDKKISNIEKRILALKSEKTTTNKIDLNIKEHEYEESKEEGGEMINSITESSISDKPTADTLPKIKENSFEFNPIFDNQDEINPNFNTFNNKVIKTFNQAREEYYFKHKLYDNLLNHKDALKPEKYKIGHNKYLYAYPNSTKTYCITLSEKLNENNDIKAQNDLSQDKNYYKSLGLCFCGKFIAELKMTCVPNQFMCKECMKINKLQYNLSQDYLINMNGRVAKIKKGSYHCYGLFVGEKESDLQNCSAKFTCKSCDLLNLYSQYYSS